MCTLYQQGKVRILAPSHKQIRHHPNDCPVPLPVYSCHDRRNERAVPERKAQGGKYTKMATMCGSHGDPDYECQFEEAECPYKEHTVRARPAEMEMETDASL